MPGAQFRHKGKYSIVRLAEHGEMKRKARNSGNTNCRLKGIQEENQAGQRQRTLAGGLLVPLPSILSETAPPGTGQALVTRFSGKRKYTPGP